MQFHPKISFLFKIFIFTQQLVTPVNALTYELGLVHPHVRMYITNSFPKNVALVFV